MGDPRPIYVAPLFALSGLVSWGLFEYAIHRFVLHAPRPLFGRRLSIAAEHVEHHRNPQALEPLRNPIKTILPVALLYGMLAWAITGSWRDTAYLLGGFTAGYLYYEWFHAAAHHGAPRLKPLREARKYHLHHHYADPTTRYGVTSPVFDLLFGTLGVRHVSRDN